jgi:hypothetical protein
VCHVRFRMTMASGSGCASIWTSGPPTVQLYVADSVCRCFRRSAYRSNCAAQRWASAGVGRLSHTRPADPSPDAARSPRQASSGSRRRASAPRVGLDGRSAPGPTSVTTSSSASATATNTSPANSASPATGPGRDAPGPRCPARARCPRVSSRGRPRPPLPRQGGPGSSRRAGAVDGRRCPTSGPAPARARALTTARGEPQQPDR